VAFARTPSSFLPSFLPPSLPPSLPLLSTQQQRKDLVCSSSSLFLPKIPLSHTHTLTNTHSGTQAHIRTHKCLCMHVCVHIACCALPSPG
jgi:hypothetical protein